MTSTPAGSAPRRLRRGIAVLGLVTALGSGVLVPSAAAATAATSTAPSASARTASAVESARLPQLRRVVSARKAPRARLVAPATAPAAAAHAVDAAPVSAAEAYQQRLLALVNQERGRRGLRALAAATCADGYANRWADSMASRSVMEHQPLLPILGACHAHAVAENVAYGNVTADRMMEMWMASPGHRTNILRPEMTHIGIGSTQRADGRVYGCQVFLDLT